MRSHSLGLPRQWGATGLKADIGLVPEGKRALQFILGNHAIQQACQFISLPRLVVGDIAGVSQLNRGKIDEANVSRPTMAKNLAVQEFC